VAKAETEHSSARPVVLLGCGRLGSAIAEGWLATEALDPAELIILTPSEKPVAEAARKRGAWINPPLEALADARVLVVAVKPAMWRSAVAPLIDLLPADAVIVSVMAGVPGAALIEAFTGRPVVRVMPTTAVAQGRGVAALSSTSAVALKAGRALFAPMATVVDLDDEARMNAATAVAGSGPAFVYAFVQAMAAAGEAQGLDPVAAEALARGALRSAGSGADTGRPLADLVSQIAAPGGTTQAGLDAMAASVAAPATAAIKAAAARAEELAGH